MHLRIAASLRRFAAAVTFILLGSSSIGGCVALAKTETGSAPSAQVVSELGESATLNDVLSICGVPLETIVQPDGLLLIYRARYSDFKRVGFEPGVAIGLVDFTGIGRAILQNIKLVFEWGKVEDRSLVVLVGPEDRVIGLAYRDRGDDGKSDE